MASPWGKTHAALRRLHFVGKKAAVTQSLLRASGWQGCESKTELTLSFWAGMGAISKPALPRAYSKGVGEGARRSRFAAVTG